jgi:hypothetical protein
MNSKATVQRVLLGTLFLVAFSRAALAEEAIYYAGFAYLGDKQHITSNYQHTYAINTEQSGQPILDQVLRDRIAGVTFPNFDLRNKLADLNSGSATALAFALDREVVSVERIGSDHKLLIELSAQAFFFDYIDMSIVGAYPIGVQYIDVLDAPPTEAYIRNLVRELYMGGLEVNIVEEFLETLQRVNIKRSYNARLRVSQVHISDEAMPFLPRHYQDDPGNLETVLANNFGKYLAKNQGIPILPYSKGYAIGNKMALKIANGDVYNLQIPKADFDITLSLEGFKKVIHQEKPAGTSWVYGAYVRVKVIEPDFGEIYLDAKFKNGALKIVPASQTATDDWPAFQEVLTGLFRKLTKELSNPSRSWAQTYSPSDGAFEGMKQFKEVIGRCV